MSDQTPPQQSQRPTWPHLTAPWDLPAPKKPSGGNIIGIIAGAAAGLMVAGNLFLGGCAALIACSANAASTPSTTFDPPPTDAEGRGTISLTSPVTYPNGVRVRLADFERGTSSRGARPASTEYVKFTVHVVNGSDELIDMPTVHCQYGSDPAHGGEQVLDTRNGLIASPTEALKPGYAITYTVACAMPADEDQLEIEAAPSSLTGTALFAGKIG